MGLRAGIGMAAGVLGWLVLMSGCVSSRNYTVEQDLKNKFVSGIILLETDGVALGIGKAKGEGILTYEGVDHPFVISGLNYGGIGKASILSSGKVYHLNDVAHFEGIYFQSRTSITVGNAGKTGMFLINKKGVVLHLLSDEENGFNLALGRGGVKIKFKED